MKTIDFLHPALSKHGPFRALTRRIFALIWPSPPGAPPPPAFAEGEVSVTLDQPASNGNRFAPKALSSRSSSTRFTTSAIFGATL